MMCDEYKYAGLSGGDRNRCAGCGMWCSLLILAFRRVENTNVTGFFCLRCLRIKQEEKRTWRVTSG